MGRFIANRQLNADAVKNIIPKIWRTKETVAIKTLKNNTFAFYFNNNEDRKRILVGGPWHFDNYILVLSEPSRFGEVSETYFKFVEFWVQIHNVPLFCMGKEISTYLGERIGKVVAYDENETGQKEGQFIRLRVRIDISKPLKRLLKVDLSGQGDIRILVIKYECLPYFCFRCGKLGHEERECIESMVISVNDGKPFGPWMRASNPQKKQGNLFKRENTTGSEKNGGSKEARDSGSGERKGNAEIELRKEKEHLVQSSRTSLAQTESVKGRNQTVVGGIKGDGGRSEKEKEMEDILLENAMTDMVTNLSTKSEDSRITQYSGKKEGEGKVPQLDNEEGNRLLEKGKGISRSNNKDGSEKVVLSNSRPSDSRAELTKETVGEKSGIISQENKPMGYPMKSQSQMEEEGGGSRAGSDGLFDVGPNKKNGWKRRARKYSMQVDLVQEEKVGEKRGMEIVSGVKQEGNKRMKEGILDCQNPIELSAGLVETKASRSQ